MYKFAYEEKLKDFYKIIPKFQERLNTQWLKNSNVEVCKIVYIESFKTPEKISIFYNKKDKIKKFIALDEKGNLVGIGKKIKENLIEITTIFNPKFTTAGVVLRNGLLGLINGGKEIWFEYIPSWETLYINDTILTAGINNIPLTGIPLGIVTKIETLENKMFIKAKIQPFYKPYKSPFYVVISFIDSF